MADSYLWREPGRAPEPAEEPHSRVLEVLIISPALPYPPVWGFAQRSFQLARHLARHHRVTFISYAKDDQGPDVEGMAADVHEVIAVARTPRKGLGRRLVQAGSMFSRAPFHAVGLRSRAMQVAVSQAMTEHRFDVVVLESSQLAWLELAAGTPLVIDEHNIESDLLDRMAQSEHSVARRAFYRLERGRYRRFEERAWSSAAGCAVTSDRDGALLSARNPLVPVAVVPNGVDLKHFAALGGSEVADRIVFTGMLDYRPNYDGILWFLDEVLPLVLRRRPSAEVQVVGIGSPSVLESLRRPHVDVIGRVPDLRVHLDEASVVVVPLRIGGGTRLKVVEAMSMGKPIVSTALGAEGLDVTPDHDIVLADDPTAFADAVCALLESRDDRQRIGGNGRALVTDRYSWASATGRLEELIRGIVGLPTDGASAGLPSRTGRLP